MKRARVELGAALLDKEMPGWAEKINRDCFDFTDPHRCILGQLYGEFLAGARSLFPNRDLATLTAEHGFDTIIGEESLHGGSGAALQNYWERAILARLPMTVV